MSKHTKEPWGFGRTGDEQIMILGDNGKGRYACNVQIHQTPRSMGLYVEEERNKANAARIVACVNALTGIDDPAGFITYQAAEIERLKQERDEAISNNSFVGHGFVTWADHRAALKAESDRTEAAEAKVAALATAGQVLIDAVRRRYPESARWLDMIALDAALDSAS